MATSMTTQGFRLSPQQRRIWSVQGSSTAFRSECVVEIEGALDRARLEAALTEIVDRYEILRTTFQTLPGMKEPVQAIAPTPAGGETLLVSGMEEPFDLVCGPLFRASLRQLAPDRHELLLSAHALCADGRALCNVVQEIARSFQVDGAGNLDEEPLQFADLSEWQNESLESEEMESGREHWRRWDLSAIDGELPLELRLPAGEGFDPRVVPILLDPETQAALARLPQAWGAPLPVCLLGCWQALFQRLGGLPGDLTGVGFSGRSYEELAAAIGPFARYLPVSARLDGHGELRAWVEQLHLAVREAEELQDAFFWGGPGHFPVVFDFEPAPPQLEAGGLRFRMVQERSCHDRFKLRLLCREQGSELSLELGYAGSLFSCDSAERLAACFRELLASAARHPDCAVDELELLGAAERQRMLIDFSRGPLEFPEDLCIHELFETQARSRPESTALILDGRSISYGELELRANHLAYALRRRGIGRGDRIGICLRRSVELVAGLLGTLKAGAAFVPLDPDYPRPRLGAMLEAAAVRAVLSSEDLAPALPSGRHELILLSRHESPCFPAEESMAPPPLAEPVDLAYIVFTSGSMGRPKGILVPHRPVVNYLRFVLAEHGLGPRDVVLQMASLSFDASVRDLLGPLAAGASVVLLPRADAGDIRAVLDAVERYRVSRILSIVPTVLRAVLAGARGRQGLQGLLQSVLVSGEVLHWTDCRRVREVFGPQVVTVNQYGPTECTMTSSYRLVREAEGEGGVPAGRPIAGSRIYVVDRGGQPAPVGVSGEVWIGGAGVTHGYLDRPDLTAAAFVPDPFGQPGTRLYRTGDLGRYLPDGELQFLGRADHQVKVRGVRVELGEVEAVLLRHPGVREVVATVREDSSGEPLLVAYFTADPAALPQVGELRDWMRSALPEAMVPSLFLRLDALPRTPNGKVDRRALPEPGAVRLQPAKTHVAPRNAREQKLAEIWSEVLGVDRIGVHDSFFELGGHSLLAARAAAAICEAFEIELPLRRLFESPVLADLARVVEELEGSVAGRRTPPIRKVPRDGILPLSFVQERMWFFEQLSGSLQNVLGVFRLHGALDVPVFARSIAEIVRRHAVLRTSLSSVAGRPRNLLAPAVKLLVPVVDLGGLSEEQRDREAELWGREELVRPFDRSRPPLLRVTLLRLGDGHHVMLLAMDHIACDRWSVGIFFDELLTLYRAFLAGDPSPLPEPPLQYFDFAQWQRELLQGEVLAEHLAFWRQALAGVPAVFEKIVDKPAPRFTRGPTAVEHLLLGAELSEAMRSWVQRESATLFMAAVAAFHVVLRHHAASDDVLSGTQVAGRSRRDLHGLIGCFASFLPVRTDLSGDPEFREVLRRVREAVLAAQARQDLPYELLESELLSDLGLGALRRIVINVIEDMARPTEFSGLSGEEVRGSLQLGTDTPILALNLFSVGSAISCRLIFSSHLFYPATVRRMLNQFETVLARGIVDPGLRLSDVDAELRERESEEARREEEAASQASSSRLRARRGRNAGFA